MNQKGNLSPLLSAGIIGMIVMFFSTLLVSSRKVVQRSSRYEQGYRTASAKLYQLLDLPWSDASLTPGEHREASPGTMRWTVESMEPRLLKVVVFAALKEHASDRELAESTMLTGYKFNDF